VHNGVIWIRPAITCRTLANFKFHQMRRISLAGPVVASQEGPGSMELIHAKINVRWIRRYIFLSELLIL